MTATLTPGSGAAEWRPDAVDLAALLASPAGLTGRELGDRLVEIDRLRRALEAATIEVLDVAERSDAYRDDGHINLSSWARCNVVWSRHEATTRIREVNLVRLCPEVKSALETGQLGIAQSAELARARANPRAGDQLGEHIAELLGFAKELDFDSFRKVVHRWEQLADVDGAHREHDGAHKARRASLTQVDDTFHLQAQFGVIQGTAMAAILDAFARAEFAADWDAVKAEHGDDAAPNMVARSESQRRADALFAIFMAAVTGEGRTMPDPVVNLVCDVQTFEEHLSRVVGSNGIVDPIDDPDLDPGDPSDASMGAGFGVRRCETVDGVRVDPSDVVAAALIGHVRRVVVDRSGVVVNCGRKTRLFRGVPREMVWLVSKTCCWPGCGHRVDLQVDHLDEFSRGDGRTDQINADPLHGRHNRFKTTHGYRITRDDHGFLHIWRPDGTELRPR